MSNHSFFLTLNFGFSVPTCLLAAGGVLFVLCVLFMRHTHPYSGSRSEPFERKQLRRRIGIFCLILSFAFVTVAILALSLMSRG